MGIATRGLAKLLMWDAASMFDNPTQMMNAIREAGFGYRNAIFRMDCTNIFQIVTKSKGGPKEWDYELYPRANMAEVTWKSDKLFMVHGEALYEDSNTGELYTRRVSLYTDNYSEGFNYYGELETVDIMQERYKSQSLVDFTPTTMWHKRGAAFPDPFALQEI